jgi:DNA polymerase sigma
MDYQYAYAPSSPSEIIYENRAIHDKRIGSNFQIQSFVKYMRNTGRAYRTWARVVISDCYLWVEAQDQSFQSDIELGM